MISKITRIFRNYSLALEWACSRENLNCNCEIKEFKDGTTQVESTFSEAGNIDFKNV
ncbi:hypothetical protein [Enterobacter cloacae]|uniref:hypothetical protein n=1 Tax=Enterobacter cloacae TaxID=550 RepID=UPI0020062284|nr:hypothetical protein [Enterobacter cloacae]MCK7383361.1 hypothetical protein [Enterobacter cloacae]